jgi:hypothetical protein
MKGKQEAYHHDTPLGMLKITTKHTLAKKGEIHLLIAQQIKKTYCSSIDTNHTYNWTSFYIYIRGSTKSNTSNSFLRNCNSNNNEITQMIHKAFAIMRLFFHKASVTFNTLLPITE